FFFQAEDGIRDLIVTGVQTCALPISRSGINADETDLREFAYQFISVDPATCTFDDLKRQLKEGEIHGIDIEEATSLMVRVGQKKIGRASCRERVEIAVVEGAVEETCV